VLGARQKRMRFAMTAAAAVAVCCSAAQTAVAEPFVPEQAKQLSLMVGNGVAFLQTKGQAENGSYSEQTGIGVTALITTALLRNGRTPQDPLVAKSL
jgi:hypothetical protein